MLIWFAETTLIAAILAAIAALACRGGRLGPSARHALWLVVLVKLVAPPVVAWPRPSWLAWPAAAEAPAVAAGAEIDDAVGPEAPAQPPGPEVAPPAPEGPSAAMVVLVSEAPIVAPAPAPADEPAPAIALPAPDLAAIGWGILVAWAGASALLAAWQAGRIARFRGRIGSGVPAPKWLEGEARYIGREMGVDVPEILVVPSLSSPMLWFLGRPKLLVPAHLIDALDDAGWRGVLAHEMAHLRRRDHWVRRLELAAGLIWWWCPLYWLTRRRLEAEAELACDEWAVRIFPGGRLALAEALLEVCRSLPPAKPPVPALGVAGSGRFLERRVAMILSDRAPSRASAPALFGAALLALLALPGWGASFAAPPEPEPPAAPSAPADVEADDEEAAEEAVEEQAEAAEKEAEAAEKAAEAAEEIAEKAAEAAEEIAEKVAEAAEKAAEAAEEAAEKAAEAAEEAAEKAAEAAERAAEEAVEAAEGGEGDAIDPARLKEIEVLGKKIGKEMEAKFGPGSEFQKQMEAFGPEMEKKFGAGSEFQKKMEAMSKEMEEKFGPGSEFQKKFEAEFGPGSKFEKELMDKFGADSKFRKDVISKFKYDAKMHPKAKAGSEPEDVVKRSGGGASASTREKGRDAADPSLLRAKVKEEERGRDAARESRSRADRIKKLQAQIKAIAEELETLQSEEEEEN